MSRPTRAERRVGASNTAGAAGHSYVSGTARGQQPGAPTRLDGAGSGAVAAATGTAASEVDDDLIGATLSGTYRVLRPLGEGGMGRVYEAQHTRIQGKRYAIKVLHPEFARRPDVRARFQREAEAAAAINHANVVGVHDVNVLPDGRPFMATELLKGRELGDYLKDRGRIPVAEAVAIVRQLCAALQAAHDCGVIHRDVKPANVFLTGMQQQPIVKVLDFGISRLEGRDGSKLTRTGVVMGTPSYMAPEQARGERVDHRADLYATGAILYRALSGQSPYDKPDTMATLAAVLTQEPMPLRTIAADVPPALEKVVQRAMARELDKRYARMDELAAALAPFEVHGPHGAGAAGAQRRRQLGSAAHDRTLRVRLLMALIGALVGLTLGVIGTVLVVGSPGDDEAAQASRDKPRARGGQSSKKDRDDEGRSDESQRRGAPDKPADGSPAPPSADAEALLAQLGHQHNTGDLAGSIETLSLLYRAAPDMLEDPRVRKLAGDVAARAYYANGKHGRRMTEIYVKEMGEEGLDLMFELIVTRGGSVADRTARRLLADPDIRVLCSSDLRVAYDLRVAGTCRDKIALLPRAGAEGGTLTLRELKIMKLCGGTGCCLSRDRKLAEVVATISRRVE